MRTGEEALTAVEVVLREAVPQDVPAVVALVESAYRGDASRAGWTSEADLLDGGRTDAAAVLEIIETPGSRVLLVERGGVPVACCQLEQQGDIAYFGMFAVSPTLQGAGLGHAVLAAAEREARAGWGAREMQMTVISLRAELVAWYERRGYRRTGERRPFPHDNERFGIPRRPDLEFIVLSKPLLRTQEDLPPVPARPSR
ncbi:GNAT family N-acetyltransferase [Actinocorallia populi]|uniref:GNAT family N-acetyltransferase n=1 Tax=Actinocorallia populi TaxID=2079200 RepID=UPI001E292E66|nr:GNAT family N-acetyltransferase [Actinocorallia populi]